jgi:shikimate dehydrogenase
MTDIFDFEKPIPLYAVMGNPIEHSRSPEIHQMFASQFSMTIDYRRIHVEVGGFQQAVDSFRAAGGQGLNVTVPFKVDACRMCDTRSDRASRAGAVNTLWFDHGNTRGDNTDGVGICTDITANIGQEIYGRRLLLLGAGGAVRGVLGQLIAQGPSSVVVANRTVDKAVELANHFRFAGEIHGCGFRDLEGLSFDIVINGTAASLHGKIPDLPTMDFSADSLAYDMMYSNEPTVFMKWSLEHGVASSFDGLGMLVEQAAESFSIWHGQRPDTRPVIRALRSQYESARKGCK